MIIYYQDCKIEYFEISGKKWLKALDVGKILHLSNYRVAVKNHCDNSMILKQKCPTTSGNQVLLLVNEEGVFNLINKTNILSLKEKGEFLHFLDKNNILNFKFILPTRKEIEFFDILKDFLLPLEVELFWQYKILNFKVDCFLKKFNLIIEYDEKHHKKFANEDRIREDLIKENIECSFLRLNSEKSHYENCGIVMEAIFKLTYSSLLAKTLADNLIASNPNKTLSDIKPITLKAMAVYDEMLKVGIMPIELSSNNN